MFPATIDRDGQRDVGRPVGDLVPFGNPSLLLGVGVARRDGVLWNPVLVIDSLLYQAARKLLAVPAVLLRRDVR
jgi:hypothetical protein